MYRTYRNLFRLRPSISSIGAGKYKYNFQRGISINIDVMILFILVYFISLYTVGQLAELIFGVWSGIASIGIAAAVAYKANKLDPAGKPVTQFLYDYGKFVFRPKYSDGWSKKQRVKRKKMASRFCIRATMLEEGDVGSAIGSLPAKGSVSEIHLLEEAKVTLRGKKIILGKGKQSYPPGLYKVKNKKLVKDTLQLR